jgi:hypothetical protein
MKWKKSVLGARIPDPEDVHRKTMSMLVKRLSSPNSEFLHTIPLEVLLRVVTGDIKL